MKYVHTRCKRERDICGAASVYVAAQAFSMPLAVAWVGCRVVLSVMEGRCSAISKENI